MSDPRRERFIFGAAIALLTVYSVILTFGLFRVQNNAEQLAKQQQSASVATERDVKQLMQYLEIYHGSSEGESQGKDLDRLKILVAEHEEKLYLLQDTINQLYATE